MDQGTLTAGGTAVGADSVHRALRRDRWAVALLALTWVWMVAPRILQSLLAPKYRSTVGLLAPPTHPLAGHATTLLTFALLALCVWIIVDTLGDPVERPLVPLSLMLAPWGYLVVRDLYVGNFPDIKAMIYPLVVTAVWMLRPRLRALATMGYLMGLAAVLSIALAVIMPDKGIFTTVLGTQLAEDKEVLPWGILVGVFSHGNTMGQVLALGLPMVALIPRRNWRLLLLAVCLFAILWSASRSAMLAVVGGGGCCCRDGDREAGVRAP